MGGERPEIHSGQHASSAKRVVTGVPPGSTRYSIFPKPTQQQTLPDTEVLPFLFPSGLGKGPESAAADMSTLSTTPTVTGTPTSVYAGQECLPYQQQYQPAECAVTSVDQKATWKSRKFFPLNFRKPSAGHLGANPPTQEATVSRKEFNSSADVHVSSRGPLL
jgi:hypothetical protein